jgi:hypothetical protein
MILGASKNTSMSFVLSFIESMGFSSSSSGDVKGDLGSEDAHAHFDSPGPGVDHMVSIQQSKKL